MIQRATLTSVPGNPNRKALADVITYLEQGTDTLIFSSGMGAITTTYFALFQPR